MKNPGIYILTNKVNDKQYVGRDVNLPSRVKIHFSEKSLGCPLIHRAIKKYGCDNFTVEIIPYPGISNKALNAVEMWKIAELNTKAPNGYNLTRGGEGTAGHTVSTEARKKISDAHRGKKLSEEHRQKLSKAHKGKKRKPRTAETRRKISEAQKGKSRKSKPHTPETRKKIGEANSTPLQKIKHIQYLWNNGIHYNVIASIVQVSTAVIYGNVDISPAKAQQKRNDANRGQKRSLETRRKISEAQLRIKSGKALTGRKRSKETRKKISNAKSLPRQKINHIQYLYKNGIRPMRVIASIVGVSKRTVQRYTKDLRSA